MNNIINWRYFTVSEVFSVIIKNFAIRFERTSLNINFVNSHRN